MATARRTLTRYLAATGFVAISALCAEILYHLTSSSRPAVVFLASVLVSAYVLGSGPAYWAAALAFLAYNFYVVEPRFAINYGGPDDLITLAVFLFVAVLVSRLTGRIKDQARAAESRARTTSVLFDATRAFSGSSDEELIRRRLAGHLARATGAPAFVRERLRVVGEPVEPEVPPEVVRAAIELERTAGRQTVLSQITGAWTLRPLYADGAVLGVAGWTCAGRAEQDQPLLDVLTDVGAAAIVRARLAAAKAEAETRARTEDLRNALLSSISHDLRTPLSAILASASSLAEFGDSFDVPTRKDLSTTIQQEAERLDAYVANLLNMTRLEAGALTVNRLAFSVPEIIDRVVARRPAAAERHFRVLVAPQLPEGLGDPVLFEQALWNVVENAIRYTPPHSALEISAEHRGDVLDVSVADHGPGLPPSDLELVFDKFFRSEVTAHKPGTGLGLSITKGLIEGMGGQVAASPRADGGQGLVMTMTVPTAGSAIGPAIEPVTG